MSDEQELFVIDYPARQPDEVWSALRRALATMDLKDADDGQMTARFSTGVSLTSWSERLLARVSGTEGNGTRVTVRGRPRGSFLTTSWVRTSTRPRSRRTSAVRSTMRWCRRVSSW